MTNPLAEATDQLTEVLRDAEDTLAMMHLGVSGRVPIDSEYTLSFEKDGSDWLFIVEGPSGRVPLVRASRRLRVLAAHQLENLRTVLFDEAEKERRLVADATSVAKDFLARLRTV